MSDIQFLGAKDQFTNERITVSTAAVGLDQTKVRNDQTYSDQAQTAKDVRASAVMVTCLTNAIYLTTDGSTPSASNGIALAAGDSIYVGGYQKLVDLKMIRQSVDSAVEVMYYK